MKEIIVTRVTLNLPDGMHVHLRIKEGESMKDCIHHYLEWWYQSRKEDPKKYDCFYINDVCPRCGEHLMARLYKNQCFIWCINYPKCSYETIGSEAKTRELIFKKTGFDSASITHKTGAAIIISNKAEKKL